MTTTTPIYKIRGIIEIPNIIRGKVQGVTVEVASFITRYNDLNKLMKAEPSYFFGILKLKDYEKKEYKIRIKSQEIIATTNTMYQSSENKMQQ